MNFNFIRSEFWKYVRLLRERLVKSGYDESIARRLDYDVKLANYLEKLERQHGFIGSDASFSFYQEEARHLEHLYYGTCSKPLF